MIGETWIDVIRQGGIVIYPLILCSVVSFAIVIERAWALALAGRGAARLRRDVDEALGEGGIPEAMAVCRRDRSPLGTIYRALLAGPPADADARTRLLERKVAEAARACRRFVWLLGTVGSLAPFIGLFGTVVGIIRAFENMAATGSGGFAVVAAGISEALVATAGGLLVGVLSIFAYNAFTVRIANLAAELREAAEELLVRLGEPRHREGVLPRVVQSR